MAPTIQAGDRLELGPPTALTIGTIIVFRNDNLLVCHRITAIDPQGTLSTRGDATQDASEVVQPGSVIGVVTGVMREGTHISLEGNPSKAPVTTQSRSLKSRVPNGIVRSFGQSVQLLTRHSVFQDMLSLLLRWTVMVDVLTPAPLQSLPSHSKVASFTLRMFPHMAGLLTASIAQKPTRYVLRLGPWRLAQYDPATESFLLRHSLQDAGLEPFFRQICGERRST